MSMFCSKCIFNEEVYTSVCYPLPIVSTPRQLPRTHLKDSKRPIPKTSYPNRGVRNGIPGENGQNATFPTF